MKKLRFICAQPATEYYTWQIETMINNFINNGINPNLIDVVCGIKDNKVPQTWRKLADHYNYVRFFFYDDDRVNPIYVSSIRPHILTKHFKAHPYLSEDAIFYHDSDMIFTKPVDFDQFVQDDIWYLSDTRFYIGAEYIQSKGMDIYDDMCKLIGIDPKVPESYEENSGGAQYIMKNVNADYWIKVERDCNDLYSYFIDHLKRHPQTENYHPIQKWTADMWAVLWNAWYFEHDTKVVPELEFVWGTQGKQMWDKHSIYHNAGVLDVDRKRLFYKGDYVNKLPYDIENYVDPIMASHYYLEEVIETGRKTALTKEPMPSVVQMAKNAASEAKGIVEKVVNKEAVIDEDLGEQRFSVCKTCPHLSDANRCSKCGCFMPTKSKIIGAKCPVDKW